MSNIILGKYISNSILDNIKNVYTNYLNIEEYKPPKVCIIQIGDNNNSNIYIIVSKKYYYTSKKNISHLFTHIDFFLNDLCAHAATFLYYE